MNDGDIHCGCGMSLRDYFAAEALGAQIRAVTDAGGQWNPTTCAKLSYEFADAMLKERNEKNSTR